MNPGSQDRRLQVVGRSGASSEITCFQGVQSLTGAYPFLSVPIKETIEGRQTMRFINFKGLFLAGLTAIIVGYIALASGSMTFAPTLLVGGYCLLIPWALFKLGHSDGSSDPASPPGE
jgi:hypothetical protein